MHNTILTVTDPTSLVSTKFHVGCCMIISQKINWGIDPGIEVLHVGVWCR